MSVVFFGWYTQRCIVGNPIALLHGLKGYNDSIYETEKRKMRKRDRERDRDRKILNSIGQRQREYSDL